MYYKQMEMMAREHNLSGMDAELAEEVVQATVNGARKGYQIIEDAVVGGYKKIEEGVVSGYKKIETVLSRVLKRLPTSAWKSSSRKKANLRRIPEIDCPAKNNHRHGRNRKKMLLYGHNHLEEVIIMNKNDQEFLVQKIRTQYAEKEQTALDDPKELDAKVKRPANVFAYVFGSVAAIVMGSGMSLIMTDISETIGMAEPMIPGLMIGIVGMFMAIINYPIYKGILGARRKKYADRVIALSEKIMKG